MTITTSNGEVLSVPNSNIRFIDMRTHTMSKQGTILHYIQRMTMRVESNNEILWSGEPTERLDFAARINRYDDIKSIELDNTTYIVPWINNPKTDVEENLCQCSNTNGKGIVCIHINDNPEYIHRKDDEH